MSRHIVFIEASTTGPGEKAIDYAGNQGYEITLFSRDPDMYPSRITNKVHRLIRCETRRPETLLKHIWTLHKNRAIDGITTTADVFVPHAARAAEALGLPSLPHSSALSVRNKYEMRRKLQQCLPELNPPFTLVADEESAVRTADRWGFPLIAKPPDANDSWNVKRIRNESELRQYMKEARNWGQHSFQQPPAEGVLLEGYIDGDEYSVETLQYKGRKIECIGVTDRALEGFVEVGASFPVENSVKDRLFQTVSRALSALQIDCGVIHTECRIKEDQVKILEINPRLAGSKIGSHLIEHALGITPLQPVVEIALNQYIPWQPTKHRGSAYYAALMPEDGVFAGMENREEIEQLPGVVDIDMMAQIGSDYPKIPRSNTDRIIKIVTEAENPGIAFQLAKEAASRTKIKVAPGE